jgi:hypothetical protein
MILKPTINLDWIISGSSALMLEPSAGLKLTGYAGGDKPAARNFNWMMYCIDQWKKIYETTDPNVVLESTDTGLATILNALAHDSYVFIKESISLSTLQKINKRITFDMAPGAKLILTGAVTSGLIFSARPHFKNLNIEIQNNITNAIQMSCDGFRIDSSLWIMNGSGKTLANTVLVDTAMRGNIRGVAIETAGTITNRSGSDIDGNSAIIIP